MDINFHLGQDTQIEVTRHDIGNKFGCITLAQGEAQLHIYVPDPNEAEAIADLIKKSCMASP